MHRHTGGYGKTWIAGLAASLFLLGAVLAPAALADGDDSGGAGAVAPHDPSLPPPAGGSGGAPVEGVPPTPIPGAVARISSDGRTAVPPAAAPEPVKQAIYSANRITRKPYRYGGGHRSFRSSGYDCSGSISYALHGGGLLASPLDSRAFARWGERGRGQWITVFTNPGHAYVVIAGLRFDTSGPGEKGPRWRVAARSSRGYTTRHPEGF